VTTAEVNELVGADEAAAAALVDEVLVCPAAGVVDGCCAADVCWVADVWAGCCCCEVEEAAAGVLLEDAACCDEETAGVADDAAAAGEESTEAEAWRGKKTFRACGGGDRLSTRSLADTRANV